ncbi:MAG: hydroxylamine reductase [bacterium]|nr:hydroxylamine reductase [bacterium]
MFMFCYQCQETAKGTGCTIKGVCGKSDDVSNLQDLLIYILKGIAVFRAPIVSNDTTIVKIDNFIINNLFATITNANFSKADFVQRIKDAIELRKEIKAIFDIQGLKIENLPDAAIWTSDKESDFDEKAKETGVLETENEDVRSLRELIVYGIKGIAAYTHHASVLGYKDENINLFIANALSATLNDDLSVEDLITLVMRCGKCGVDALALLDKANTETYGHPEISNVNIGVRNNPAILISGHDLKDMEELLKQTENTGVDVYTHSEMLPANYYPAFKKYEHFVGNYGNAWWKQVEEFEKFNGPVLMTTNCIVTPKDTYKDRVYITGVVGFDDLKKIENRKDGNAKDFSAIIEHARQCQPPTEIETGSITGGFAHNTVAGLATTIADCVKSGAIKKFIVMAGCDGRMKSRDYYTEFAKALPQDNVILTAGCAKYRYNKLDLGSVNGVNRVLDAGQCNDSYSLVVTALKLQEMFGLADINDLPVEYNIAWYEQKAVIVLLALLSLGVKNIHLGPTLPAFVSANVASVLIEKFGIASISGVKEDIEKMTTA